MKEAPEPASVIFFANGTAAVGDQYDQTMPKYQVGNHQGTIAALAADGYQWHTLRVSGIPQLQDLPAGRAILRERISRINISAFLTYARGYTMRVWRQEDLDKNVSASGPDMDIQTAIGRLQDYPRTPLEIAKAILEVERVNAVEVTDMTGLGEVLYKDWP